MNDALTALALTLALLGFFALIGFAVWYTHSGLPLFALLLSPTFSIKSGHKDKE